ncbi:MAG: hypothetical protein KOO63_08300 [Bacteroidales bacterium]|nr:hypothetical protein [Candidatus Latescibacterota bacterium]
MAMHITTQKFKSWADLRITLNADDIEKLDPQGATIRLMVRPNGDGYLVAGPEIVLLEDKT